MKTREVIEGGGSRDLRILSRWMTPRSRDGGSAAGWNTPIGHMPRRAEDTQRSRDPGRKTTVEGLVPASQALGRTSLSLKAGA